jgi:hypothetical protein
MFGHMGEHIIADLWCAARSSRPRFGLTCRAGALTTSVRSRCNPFG